MSKEEREQSKNEKGGHKSAIIIAVITAVIIIVLVGVILFLLNPQEEKPRDVVVRQDNVKEVIQQMQEEEKVPVGSYEVSMNTEWIFPSGDEPSSNAYVENSTANSNMVYFIITVEEEEIYHSPYMEVGSYLENIQLDKNLGAGSYSAVITYYLVDDTFTDLSQVSLRMQIIVEN